jgi:hypothetical protein
VASEALRLSHLRNKRVFKRAELTQAQQLLFMRWKFPQLIASVRRQRSIVWEGPWRPSELGDVYTVRISYTQGLRPRIAVVQPTLALAAGKKELPHIYSGQEDICIHRPEEWHKGMVIADTIMPWLSQWLYFFEIWAITGKWFGKGTHPNLPQHGSR